MRFAKSTSRLIYFTSLLFVLIFHSTFIDALNPIPLPRSVFTVNTSDDTQDTNASDGLCMDINGNCSLRAAVMSANYTDAADEIILPAGTYNLTRNGDDDNALNGDLDILRSLTITGADRDTTIIVQTQSDHVFEIDSLIALNIPVSISGLTVKNLTKFGAYGYALVSNDSTGTLTLNNVLMMTGFHGLTNASNATVIDSTITGMGDVGINTYSLTGTTGLTVLNSVISNNDSGGIAGDNLLIENTLFTGNLGESVIDINSGKILNSTITGNTARSLCRI